MALRARRVGAAFAAFACALASPASDLAAQSVQIVTDINLGSAGSYPSYLVVEGEFLYFRANDIAGGNDTELWRYDGATAERIADINPGPTGSSPADLTFFRGELYFSARDCSSCATKLWRFDGDGVALAPGGASGASLPQDLVVYRDQLVFRAFRSGFGSELWRFDGSSQTQIDLVPGGGSSYPQHFFEFQGELYFNAGLLGDGGELFRYDGSTARLALNITPGHGSSPEHFVEFEGDLYFSANDGEFGRELWRFDGVSGVRVADIQPGAGSSNPSQLTVFRDAIYFAAEDDPDGPTGNELWRFDGTRAELVANINANEALPGVDPVHHSWPASFLVHDDVLYFTADDGIHGRELWKFDGETASMVADIWPGPVGSNISELVVFQGRLYFSADDGTTGGELGTSRPALWSLTGSGSSGEEIGGRLVRVLASGAPVPDASVALAYVGIPALDVHGNVALFASTDDDGSGAYLVADGELRVLADASTPIPGQPENRFAHGFRGHSPSIDDGVVSFYAFTGSTELGGGVYTWRDGIVRVVADTSTTIPGGVGRFDAIEDPFGFGPFAAPAIDRGDVAFRGAADSPRQDLPRQRGVYTSIDSVLDVVADLATPIPDGEGAFVFLGAEISMEHGRVAFRGEGANFQRGIYTDLSGELARVVDLATPIPGGEGLFTSVGYPRIDRGRILFGGDGADGQQGIYLWRDGAIERVVDRSTPIPEGTGTFTDFLFNASPPSISGDGIAFRGLGSDGQEGLYLVRGGVLRKIVDRSDTIGGRSIRSLAIGPHSLVGATLSFHVRFSDGGTAILATTGVFRRGDVNADGRNDISDPVSLLLHLFAGADPEGDGVALVCHDAADVDDSGRLGISDAIHQLRFLLLGGPPPAAPYAACGVDSTLDALDCEREPDCDER